MIITYKSMLGRYCRLYDRDGVLVSGVRQIDTRRREAEIITAEYGRGSPKTKVETQTIDVAGYSLGVRDRPERIYLVSKRPPYIGCPKCGHAGDFIRMALCCPVHGVFGGC